MQTKKEEQQKLFYAIGLDRLVPLGHPVRRIKDVLDLRFLYRKTREFYSTEGKPSVDPVVLFNASKECFRTKLRTEKGLS